MPWVKHPRPLSLLKSAVMPDGRTPRRVRLGVFAGCTMLLNLRHQTQLMLGLYERELGSALRQVAQGLASAADVGAAEGAYTLFFALHTRASPVYAFEPDDESRQIMTANLILNSLRVGDRIVVSDKRVGVTQGGRTCRLDDVLAGCPMPCLIKVDVEGGELDVLRGAQQLLRSDDVRWVIETHSADLELACIETLRAAGYTTRIIRNAWWRVLVPEMRPIPHNRWVVGWRA